MPEISGMIQQFLEGNIKTLSAEPVIESKTITENGTYTAPEGVDGYSPVVVNVEPVIESKTITENGTYTPDSGVDGFAPVVVNVQSTAPILKAKNITENGTYDASDDNADGYSQVNVNVPLPQNAYLLKSVANLPQAIASFSDGEDMVMPSLKVSIEPQQEGSGDPSPTNVRPISGWSAVDVTVADDVENSTVSNVYTIDLDGTRYGGEVDLVSGVLTVDRAYVDLGSLSYIYDSINLRFQTTITGIKRYPYNVPFNAISEIYKTVSANNFDTNRTDSAIRGNQENDVIFVRDTRFTTSPSLINEISGKKLVYELATPITIQLTPTQVKSLLGQNNIWADTGDITDAEYFSKED